MSSFDPGSSSGKDFALQGSVDAPASAYFRINESGVIYQVFDQEVVAVHLNTGSYHTLPGIAGEAFLLIGPTGSPVREIAVELAARYEASLSIIERDLEVFFAQLLEQTMIVAIDAPQIPRPSATAASDAPRKPYNAPVLESFRDLEGLVLIDPVHDVGAAGWPRTAPDSLDDEKNSESADALPDCWAERDLRALQRGDRRDGSRHWRLP